MKSILLSAVAILGLSVAAGCTTTTSDGSGGGGEGGGGTGGGSTTNVTTGTTSNTTTSTGGLECDSGVAAAGDSTECDACLDCAIDPAGPCAQPLSVCQASTSCQNFVTCLTACSENSATDDEFTMCLYGTLDPNAEPVAGSCLGDEPTGADEYLTILSCGICTECPNNCDAASQCSAE